MRINGTFIGISNYKQLIILVDEKTHGYVKQACPTATWGYKQTVNNVTKDEQYYVKITLDKYDKAILEKKFEPHLKKHCSIVVTAKSFTAANGDYVQYLQHLTSNFKNEARVASSMAVEAVATGMAKDDIDTDF